MKKKIITLTVLCICAWLGPESHSDIKLSCKGSPKSQTYRKQQIKPWRVFYVNHYDECLLGIFVTTIVNEQHHPWNRCLTLFHQGCAIVNGILLLYLFADKCSVNYFVANVASIVGPTKTF